jgi:hypothetical protein
MKKIFIVCLLGLFVLLAGCGEADISKVEKDDTSATKASAEPQETKETEETSGSEETTVDEPEETPPSNEIYSVGDTVTFNSVEITVNSVREDKGNEYIKPDDGNVYFIVDIMAENKGSKEENISSMLQTEVVDEEGYSYTVTFGPDVKGSFDGAVGAGRKMRGEIVFEVPAEGSLEFIFSDPFQSGQAIWKIR